jgi:Protein of unknown function (DUF4232)
MANHGPMRSLTVCLAVLAALSLTACGASSSSSSTASSTTAAVTTTTAATATTTTASTPATTTATTPVTPVTRPPRCTAASLALRYLGQQGATGHGEIGFALKNITGSSCRTYGYPGVLFLDRTGHPLPTLSTRTTHDFFGPAPAAALIVAPGASVSFRLGVTHGISSPAGCTTAYALQVIPPDDTSTLRTTIPMGAYECGTTTVSPLRRGVSAFV